MALLLGFLSMRTACLCLPFARELMIYYHMLLVTIVETYHVDLGHGVDEDDGEDGDGEAEEEGAGEIPDDAPIYNRSLLRTITAHLAIETNNNSNNRR